jgi:multicomponent Na+:H+ antiporter subunit E
MLIWICLVGFSLDLQHLGYLVAASAFTLIFAIKFNLLPTRNLFNINATFYCLWLLKEIFMSALAVSRIAWRKHLLLQPELEPIKTIQDNELGTVIYANSITLTPGTVTLSVEGGHLLVHSLDYDFMNALQEGEMDRKIKKVIK